MDALPRCLWRSNKPLRIAYHDTEWGAPVREDGKLFEMLVLEGAQAGLSWDTILSKRTNYRRALDDYDVAQIARYDSQRIEPLMQDAGIVRNRRKLEATVENACPYLAMRESRMTLHYFVWAFIDGRPIHNAWVRADQVPASTPVSDRLSKALEQPGFRFVGSKIAYAFMQSIGMVNDHLVTCFRHVACARMQRVGRNARSACYAPSLLGTLREHRDDAGGSQNAPGNRCRTFSDKFQATGQSAHETLRFMTRRRHRAEGRAGMAQA